MPDGNRKQQIRPILRILQIGE